VPGCDSEGCLVYPILEAARVVHGELGPGFVESIYTRALLSELRARSFQVDREKVIKIWYGACVVGKHRLDLVVEQSVIIELKANRGIIPVHVAQLRSYLCASDYPLGLILNFGLTELQWERIERESERRRFPS
jgi:GxxExxY protein